MDVGELSMLLEVIDVKEVTQEEFNAAADKAKGIKGLDQDQQLLLYSLFKQATIGDVNTAQPYSFDFVNAAKWKAWNSFKGFPRKNALIAYVYIVTQLLSGQPIRPVGGAKVSTNDGTGESELPDNENAEAQGMGVIVSTLYREYDQSMSFKESEAIFQAVVDHSLEKVKECLDQGIDPNAVNDEKMTPLHFAADRGFNDIVQLLLSRGAKVDPRDGDEQTPLMCAVSCENTDVVRTLVEAGADVSMYSTESGFDQEDVAPEIYLLLVK